VILQFLLLTLKHRTAVVATLLLITVVTALGLPRIRVDTGVDSLIPASDPARLVYQRVMGEFGTDNKTMIYLRDPQLWSVEKLGRIEKLHRAIESLDDVSRVDSVYSLHTVYGAEGKVDSKPVLAAAPVTAEEALAARDAALGNPLYVGNFFSNDGNVMSMIVSANNIDDDPEFDFRLNDALESLLAAEQPHFERAFQVGSPRIGVELRRNLRGDFLLLGPLSALILVVSILLFMRNGIAALIPLLTAGVTIVWTFGLMGWLGIPVNILSAMIPSLIIVIGATEDTHMMAAFFRGLEDSGEDPRGDAIRYTLKHIGLPLVLTALTTALGFGANLFSEIELIQHFAFAATFAMLANGIITLLLVPIVLSVFGPQRKSAAPRIGGPGIAGSIMKMFRYSQSRFPLRILAITAALCVFFIYHASTLYVTNDPLSYFPTNRPLIQDTKRIHRDLAGIKIFFISIDAGREKAFLEPGNVAKLVRIQEFMRQQGVFDRSISFADHLMFVHREFHGGAASGLPHTRQLVAQYLMFFHRGDLDSYVSHDYSRANIVVRHNVNDSHTLNRYIEELREYVEHTAGPETRAFIVGENLMINRAAESLMVGQIKALFVLLGLIFLIMSAMFTSPKGGGIALIPAIIPIAMMFGIMGLLDIPLNPGTAMVAVIAIGIAIDGTIHLLARYNELCRRTSDYVAAVNQAVDEVAMPLIASSMALAFGFGILLLSNFTIVAQFGALAAATMLFSIFANLLITPIIMTRVRLVGLYQILGMHVDREVLDRSPLFRDMTEYQRRKAILISELHEFRQGELLVEQDTIGRSMYLILSGQAEVVRRDNGKSRVLATLNPGQVFGEIGYIREMQRTADVRALTPITALRFDYERMQKDLKFFPNIVAKLNFNISYILGERLADMVGRPKE
jgi:predicted RND superfamily exporter protein